MQIVLVLAVLAALLIAENSPSQPVSGAGYRLILAASGMLLVALFAAVSSGLIARRLRRDFQRRIVLLSIFRNLRRVHVVLWLAVAGGVLSWLDWAQLVRFNWHLDRTILLDDILILAPILLPMALSWAAFYEVDRAVRVAVGSQGSPEPQPSTRQQYLALHARHYLGISLLPVLGLLSIQDTADLLWPGILQTPYAPAIYLPPIALLFVLFPSVLRHVWKTRPLPPGPLRSRLQAAARRAGFRGRDILIWQTNGMVVNAAVAGFLPSLRYVFLTDGLLARLTDEEIEAVFGHEIGHIRHRHLLLRLLAITAPLSLYFLAEQAVPGLGARIEEWALQGGGGVDLPSGLLVLAVTALYLLLVFGVYSRLLESQADLFGCRSVAADGDARPVDTFISALEKLAARGGVDRNARAWQHGSIARRVDFLNRVASDPGYGRRFERRVRGLSGLLVLVVLSPLVYSLLIL